MIFDLVLSTKEMDKDSKAHIYDIEDYDDRKELQVNFRHNNYQPKNFGWGHTALLAVNRKIRKEVETYCNQKMVPQHYSIPQIHH